MSDVFMYGCFLSEVLFRCVPFAHISNLLDVSECILHGDRPPFPNDASFMAPLSAALLQRCWEEDPLNRCTMADLADAFEQHFHREETPRSAFDADKSPIVSHYVNLESSSSIPSAHYASTIPSTIPSTYINVEFLD